MNNIQQSPRHEVLVRFARTDAFVDGILGARAQLVLDAAELAVLVRLPSAGARRDYLAAHTLTRIALAERMGIRPDKLRFRFSERARPELVAPSNARNFHHSISHADGIVLCAISEEYAVGADVEHIGHIGPDPLIPAEAVCSDRELDALRTLPNPAQAEQFLAVWTLKEALSKALGEGLRLPMEKITILLPEGGPPAVEFEPEMCAETLGWQLALRHLSPWHVAAVAAQTPNRNNLAIRFEEFFPGHPLRVKNRTRHAPTALLPQKNARRPAAIGRRSFRLGRPEAPR